MIKSKLTNINKNKSFAVELYNNDNDINAYRKRNKDPKLTSTNERKKG